MKTKRLALIFFILAGNLAFGTTNVSNTLVLVGIVQEFLNISIPSSQISIETDLNSENPFNVGNIVVSSSTSWSIIIESKNSGFLVNSYNPEEKILYEFALGSLSTNFETLQDIWISNAQSATLKSGLELPLIIILRSKDPNLTQGVYSDLLTICINQF